MAPKPRSRRPGGPPVKSPSPGSRTGRKAGSRKSVCSVVGIGASAGGLEAFTDVLESLPADTGMSFVFVSHLDPTHESILTSLFARTTPMPVVEAKHGMRLEPNHVYVIPRNARMTIDECVLSLARRPRAPAENLPIDHFLKSLARDRKKWAIGVILSGTASDGTAGLTAIKSEGGVTLAQEPGTAKYDGMPKSAIKARVVDFVLPPKGIAGMLARMARTPGSMAAAAAKVKTPPKGGLPGIFDLLRERTGADFSTYKAATVERRLNRRMVLRKTRDIADYFSLLRREPAEVDALYEDLLIKVTGFFRDPKTFEKLKTNVLPALLRTKSPKEPFRVWVPGCSTGEEAYSIAMLLFEVTSRLRLQRPIQIFGTDLSEPAIAVARKGIYPASALDAVSRARRRRFFMESGQDFRIIKQIRDACVFARQDITTDPPFSRMDLVSCRNVLIYMGKTLHDTILPIFHYALKPDGCLLLGKAETLDLYTELFTAIDSKNRIYRKKAAAPPQLHAFGTRRAPRRAPRPSPRATGAAEPYATSDASLREEANRLLAQRFAPAGVVINEKKEVLEILGNAHPYVRLTPGTANLSLLRLVRPDLVAQLTSAIDLAKRKSGPVRMRGPSAQGGRDGRRGPNLEVIPMTSGPGMDHRLLVLFEAALPPPSAAQATGKENGLDARRLRKELADSQEHVRLLMDVRQSAEEGLKSANEELMSSMEELQSANEELQTSREELESTNEELTTANEQLAVRNRDLSEIGNDLTNLVTSVNVPIVMLTGDLRLRRSTTAADRVMGLTPADVGRHISQIRHTLRFPDLEKEAAEVLRTLETKEIEVQERSDVWYLMRLRPYRTEDDRIEGLVIVLLKIDQVKRTLEAMERARNFNRTIVEAVQEPLLVLNEERNVLMANRSFGKLFHLAPAAIENRPVHELKPGEFGSPAFKSLVEEAIAGRRPAREAEIEFKIGNAPPVIMAIDARQYEMSQGQGKTILLGMKDITRFRHAEKLLLAARDTVVAGRQRAESSLRESKDDLRASRAELRVLAGRLINSQEQERARVARELHDDLSQRLAALQLESADLARLAAEAAPAGRRYEAHYEHLAEIAEEVRRLAHDLHPSVLGHLGLWAALRSFCTEFSGREGIEVVFEGHNEPVSLKEVAALCLYRVTQEALRNVARHSGATSVLVRLKRADNGLSLTIQDNGKGFDAGNLIGKGLGLLSMKERMRLVDGTWQVSSRRGHGTIIKAWVPAAPLSEKRKGKKARSTRRGSSARSKRARVRRTPALKRSGSPPRDSRLTTGRAPRPQEKLHQV